MYYVRRSLFVVGLIRQSVAERSPDVIFTTLCFRDRIKKADIINSDACLIKLRYGQSETRTRTNFFAAF